MAGILTNAILAHLIFLSSAFPKDWFRIIDLKYDGELISYHVEDLNNDRLKDMIIIRMRRGGRQKKERWLSVYFQTANGFASSPVQDFPIKKEQIVFDVGDVTGDQKKELVYFARNALYYYPLADSGFTWISNKLMDTTSLFMLPGENKSISFDFIRDVNADGVDDIMVPNVTHLDLYFKNQADGLWRRNRIRLPAESSFSGFYHPRYSVGHRVNASYSMPYLVLEDFNADNRNDIIAVYRDSMVVYCQESNGWFSPARFCQVPLSFGDIWRGHKIQRSSWGDKSIRKYIMRITDLDGDKLVDVVAVQKSTRKSIMSPVTDVRIHFGHIDSTDLNERFYFSEQPDQIVRPGGTQLALDIQDLNHDGKQDLLLPVVKVGLGNIIRMLLTKSVEINAETFLMKSGRQYPKTPDRKNRLVVNFTFSGGTTSPVYELADFNADGFLDILCSLEQKKLAFIWGKPGRAFEAGIGTKYKVLLPQNGEHVNAMQLNIDGKADIIISYPGSNPRTSEFKQILRILLSN